MTLRTVVKEVEEEEEECRSMCGYVCECARAHCCVCVYVQLVGRLLKGIFLCVLLSFVLITE